MPAETDSVKLQLAMAFGQGAGAMLANAQALETLLAEQGDILTNAIGNWNESRWAFIELVRILGQLSATHAAVGGSAEIRWIDIQPSLAHVLTLCPCREAGPQRRRPDAQR
jgi:hypothetical protein